MTRAQMATFLVALQELLTGTPMPAGATPFTDADGRARAPHREGLHGAAHLRRSAATTYGAGLRSAATRSRRSS